jgi:ribosomal protein L33
MNTETKLARALRAVGEQGQQLESTASAVLGIIKDAKALSIKKFDKLVRAAYKENGWNARSGRPVAGDAKLESVPGTVRTYVTVIRRAMRLKLKVGKYQTFTALRTALELKSVPRKVAGGRKSSAEVFRLPAPIEGSFTGVSIEEKNPNGALFHDLAITYAKLPSDHQALFERQVKRLIAKYAPFVPGAVGKELVAKAA